MSKLELCDARGAAARAAYARLGSGPKLAFLLPGALLCVACSLSPSVEDDGGLGAADTPARDGGASPSEGGSAVCFSPTQALDIAYTDGATGCPCSDAELDQCIKGVALVCEGGRWQAVEDGPCQPHICAPGHFQDTTGACVARKYTQAACAEAGGTAIADPGDGSVVSNGCPRGLPALGIIDEGWDEGGLCCHVTPESCGPQKVPSQAPCSAEQRHFYLGAGCTPIAVCTCSGTDCDEGFATQGACEAAYRGCDADVTRCGGWFSGNRCEPNEFCAYRGIYGCGVTDGSSVCHPRPTACDDVLAPVCACDARTYSNECEANRAGQGVFAYSPCD